MVNYDNGKTGFSLGTNLWGGGVTDGDNQRTSVLSFRSGDFGFSYENDGSPFNYGGKVLSNDTDMYRTAAIGIGIGDFSLKTNLFTGKSGTDESGLPFENAKINKELVDLSIGRNGNGLWKNELADKYRLGALTIGYKGMNIGVNSEHVRDFVQNWFAHTIVSPQPGFRMLSNNWAIYSIYQTKNKFTQW